MSYQLLGPAGLALCVVIYAAVRLTSRLKPHPVDPNAAKIAQQHIQRFDQLAVGVLNKACTVLIVVFICSLAATVASIILTLSGRAHLGPVIEAAETIGILAALTFPTVRNYRDALVVKLAQNKAEP